MGPRASAGAVRKLIASYIGLNPETQAKMIAGEIEVGFAPTLEGIAYLAHGASRSSGEVGARRGSPRRVPPRRRIDRQ